MRSIPMTEVPAVPGSLASPIPVRRRLLYGVIVALGLFALIEGAGWAIWGPPPPPQALIRVTASSIVLKGDEAVLSHLSTPRQNVAVPLNPPHGKPRVIFLG